MPDRPTDGSLRTPGLKRRANKAGTARLYWCATPRAVKLGYPQTVVALHDTDPKTISSRCLALQAAMLEWLAARESVAILTDPTVAQLAREYLTREESPFHGVKWNTQRTYRQTLGILETTWGNVRLADINLAVLRRWYKETRFPAREADEVETARAKGEGLPPLDLLRKAHGVIGIIRRLVAFGVAAEIDGCLRLDTILSKTEFEVPKPRTSAMTFAHVQAIITEALKVNRDRHRAAVRVAATTERRDRRMGASRGRLRVVALLS